MTRAGNVVRALGSLATLVALLVAVPWGLARYGNWPITGLPDRDWWHNLSDTAVSDSTVFAVLTIAAWAVWALFALSVLVEIVAALRGVQAPRLALAGPLQRSARALVVTVLLGLSAHHQAAAAAADPPHTGASLLPSSAVAATVVVDVYDPSPLTPVAGSPDGVGGGVSVDEGTGETIVTIQHGDSPWELAETHLGDGARWRALWEHNRDNVQPDGRTWNDPEVIYPGWQVRIPQQAGDATNAPSANSIETAATPAGVVPLETGQVVHVVELGDTLWDLADHYLGDPTRFPEIFAANQSVIQPDGRSLTDTNLILPGWQLTIPAPAPAPPLPPLPPPPEPAPAPTAAEPTPPEVVAPAPTPSTTTPTTTPTTTTPPLATVADAHRDDTATGLKVPMIAGITGGIVVSSGIALRIVWLRRRRATRAARHTHLPASDIERAVVAASDVPLVRWAGQHLARLVRDIDRRHITAAPIAVELSAEAGIEVLWDQPQHAPTPPAWSSADGGWAWRLPYDPDEAVPADELPAAIPALVTIGRREGRQLLVDLEAFGLLTVTGPDQAVDAFLRSFVVELAAGNDLSDAYITAVNIDTALDATCDRLTVGGLDEAVRRINSARRSNRDVLDHAGLADTFSARAGDTTPIEAVITIANPPSPDDNELAESFTSVVPRCGVAAVVAAEPIDGAAHVRLDDDGTARLEPLGLTFEPVGLPRDTTNQLHEALTALADLPDEPVDDSTAAPSAAPAAADSGVGQRHRLFQPEAPPSGSGTTGNGHHSIPAAPNETTDPSFDNAAASEIDAVGGQGSLFPFEPDSSEPKQSMVVRVLGVPSIPERPGIGRRELILAVLLACRGGTLAATAAQDALWGGKPVEAKTVWNFVAKTRGALGEFDDGRPVMPSADRARGTLRLDPRVTTDLAVLVERLEQARQASSSEAISLLQDGLALVDGPPFDAAGFDWAHRDQDVAYASTAIEQTAETLVTLALEADLVDNARDALTRALRGLPGDEQLYRLRMRVEHHAGNHAGIVAAYDELGVYLADLETEPSPATTALYHELTRRART